MKKIHFGKGMQAYSDFEVMEAVREFLESGEESMCTSNLLAVEAALACVSEGVAKHDEIKIVLDCGTELSLNERGRLVGLPEDHKMSSAFMKRVLGF